jgi:hypothetical protein
MATVDDDLERNQVTQLYNGLTVNAIVFGACWILFEANRSIKLVYLRRLKVKYTKNGRVPLPPSPYPLLWIFDVLKVRSAQTYLIHTNYPLELVFIDWMHHIYCCKMLSSYLNSVLFLQLYAVSNKG